MSRIELGRRDFLTAIALAPLATELQGPPPDLPPGKVAHDVQGLAIPFVDDVWERTRKETNTPYGRYSSKTNPQETITISAVYDTDDRTAAGLRQFNLIRRVEDATNSDKVLVDIIKYTFPSTPEDDMKEIDYVVRYKYIREGGYERTALFKQYSTNSQLAGITRLNRFEWERPDGIRATTEALILRAVRTR